MPYGSIQHIAYFIPAIVILLVFVLLPSFLLLTLPTGPQLFGRLLIAVPPLRKLQRIQTFCSNVYTDRWVYHFINVFQGCYKERFRSFSSLYLIHALFTSLWLCSYQELKMLYASRSASLWPYCYSLLPASPTTHLYSKLGIQPSLVT